MLTDMQLTEEDIWPGRTALLKTGMLPLTFNARTQELKSSHYSFPLMYLKEEKMDEPLFLLYTLFEDSDWNAYPPFTTLEVDLYSTGEEEVERMLVELSI
jgi:hypothetical protein